MAAAPGDALARPDLGRTPGPEPRPRLIEPSNDPQAIQRATLAEAVAATALHYCSHLVPWHAANLAMAAADDQVPNTELLRHIALLRSVAGAAEAEAAMAALEALDSACRAWAPHAHPIGRATTPTRLRW